MGVEVIDVCLPEMRSGRIEGYVNTTIALSTLLTEVVGSSVLRTHELSFIDGDGTRLKITENGTISNLLFRFMARFLFGYTATLETYLIDLGAEFGEQTRPVTKP